MNARPVVVALGAMQGRSKELEGLGLSGLNQVVRPLVEQVSSSSIRECPVPVSIEII